METKQRRPKQQQQVEKQQRMQKQKRRHPLKMPLRTDPITNRIICRFHNYDAKSGCKKYNNRQPSHNNENKNPRALCELDHETCHICLQKGHPAHRCIHFDDPNSDTWRDFCSLTLENTRPECYPTNKTVLGDPIIWIGDTATVTIPRTRNYTGAGEASTSTTTTIVVSPPSIAGFKVGENDQLTRCKRQKKIEAAYMLRLQHGSVIVDAGAHFGDTVFTLAIHARANNRRDLRFVALEPCPEKCSFIRSVIAANNLHDAVQVRCSAVGDAIGEVRPASNAKDRARRDGSLRYEYFRRGQNSRKSTVAHSRAEATAVSGAKYLNEIDVEGNTNGGVDTGIINCNACNDDGITESDGDSTIARVPIITLDSIFDQVSPLGMLHIDVEGWESNVLRGAKKLLTSIPEHSNGDADDNDSNGSSNNAPPCFVIAEAWTERESLRRGVSGNAEEKIVSVMEHEFFVEGVFEFVRVDDIVDIERNLVYARRHKSAEARCDRTH